MVDLQPLIKLKQVEIQKKYESIEQELEAWKKLTAAKQPLEKHHRQVSRLTRELAGMIKVVRREVVALQQPLDLATLLYQLPRAEYLILEVHRTWHFFREKLVVRQGPPFANLLEALDEFAWWCYHPIFEQPPEPPLTFFSSDWSPMASFRHAVLPLEQTVDAREGRVPLDSRLTRKRLDRIVIPVISLPWFESTFLPEALFLAHEVAHLVDNELDLEPHYKASLKATSIDMDHLTRFWLPWSAEIFADLYAVLCLGPAFVGALMMRIARSADEVLSAPREGSYPPPHVRMLLALGALSSLDFASEANTLRNLWNATYGTPVVGQPGTYEIRDYDQPGIVAEVDKIVDVLLTTAFLPLHGKPIKELTSIRWTKEHQHQALIVSELLRTSTQLPTGDARILLAGAQLAFQQAPIDLFSNTPTKKRTMQSDVVERILTGRKPGLRSRQTLLEALPPPEATAEEDEAKGERLAEAFLAAYDASNPLTRASEIRTTQEEDHV